MIKLALWMGEPLYTAYSTAQKTKTFTQDPAIQAMPLPTGKNFAQRCNCAAAQCTSDWMLFFSDAVAWDETIHTAIDAVYHAISHASAALGVFELHQLPLAAGHHINPITLETHSIDCEAFACRCNAWTASGGLDPNFDLHIGFEFACRIRAAGFTLQYLPNACVTVTDTHDRLASPTCLDYAASWREKLLLEAKYGTIATLSSTKMKYFAALKSPKHYPGVRKVLLKNLFSLMGTGWSAYLWKSRNKALYRAVKKCGYDPSSIPQRGRCAQFLLDEHSEKPLVSVVVRTCARPAVLAETLRCFYHQTYKNFEIVIIEDGLPTAEELVKREFSDLPIHYFATQKNVGRGRAGNIGIERANGTFVCFLDDDDFYYPDYIEASVAYLLSEEGLDFLYTPIMAFEANVTQRTPSYEYQITKYYAVIFDHLNLMDMCIKCRVPMSGGMFKRSLYDIVGGMREDIDGDEDWAMWLRYSMVGHRKETRCLDIPRAESLFGYPADQKLAQERLTAYEKFDFEMLSDEKLRFNVSRAELLYWKEQALRDLAHLKALGRLDEAFSGREKWPRYSPVLPENENETIVLTALQINGYYQSIVDAVRDGALSI